MLPITRRDLLKSTAAAWAFGPDRTASAADSRPESAPIGRRSFSFLHTYEATGEYWRGIEKAGLIRSWTAVRLVHSPFGNNDARRFNAVARIGGDLHRILSRRKCPLIIDRVAGGSPYHVYDFDQKLIATYAEMLGDAFLGGQVHETVCNVHNDWQRITKAAPRFATDPVEPEPLRPHFTWDKSATWLEYGTLDDYAGRRCPTGDWWSEVAWATRRQAARFGNYWSYAEGSRHGALSWPRFYEFGAASCFAEVGPWASTATQWMIANTRSTSRTSGRTQGG